MARNGLSLGENGSVGGRGDTAKQKGVLFVTFLSFNSHSIYLLLLVFHIVYIFWIDWLYMGQSSSLT